MAEESARLGELYARVSGRTQALASGFLSVDSAGDAAVAQLVWSANDLVNSATSSFQVHHHVSGLSGAAPKVHRGLVPASWDVAYTSVSPSRKAVVTLKQDAGKAGEDPEGVFSVFASGRLVSTFKAPKTLHGGIYLGEREGGFAWSHDETRIAYVAEKVKSPADKSAPFWENVNSPDKTKKKTDSSKSEEDDVATVLPGNKFLHEDDWGERYVGRKTGAVFVATLATGKIESITGIPENVTCADVTFTPGDKGLVFTGTETDKPRRLGILYCYNRRSELYEVEFPTEAVGDADAKKKFTVVKVLLEPATDADEKSFGSVRSLRFSPDGKKLAFLGTREIVTHGTCSFLGVADWATKRVSSVVPVKDEPEEGYTSAEKVETAFNGLFTGSLSRNAWSADGKYVFFDTQVGSRVVWKYVDVSTAAIVSPKYVDGVRVAVETVLDRHDAGDSFFALVSVSSPTRAPSVYLVSIDAASGKYARPPIAIEVQDEAEGTSPYIKDWQVYSIPTSVSDSPPRRLPILDFPGQDALKDLLIPQVSSTAPFEAALLLPAQEPPSSGYPVVLELHGGPHGNAPVMYRGMCDYFAALGFAVVTVNYRGSTGYGRVALESLVGRVGTQDVFDCHYALQHLLAEHPTLLDASKVHCSGGSHGGFLVQHLISQFPGYYKSTVTRNPVANIASMFYSTDIPDWALAAAGVQRFESILSAASPSAPAALSPQTRLAILNKLWQHSPVANDLSKVTTPVLYGLGGKDRRVPPTQGLEFRATLEHHGVKTKLLWYPDDSHPLASVAASSDFAVNWGLWLLAHNPRD